MSLLTSHFATIPEGGGLVADDADDTLSLAPVSLSTSSELGAKYMQYNTRSQKFGIMHNKHTTHYN